MPIIPVTRKAETRELLEPWRQRLQWAEIQPLHSSLGSKSETPSQKKKNLEILRQPFKKRIFGWVWRLRSVIPALGKAEAGGSLEVKSSKPAWPIWWNTVSTKITQIGWVQQLTPVIPALWDAEAGISQGSSRLAWPNGDTLSLLKIQKK